MSDYRERSNRRRDERQTKAPSIRPPGGSIKNTKKWCRGVVGREHKPEAVTSKIWKEASHGDWKDLTCSACGKILDYYWPMPALFSKQRPPPDWYTRSLVNEDQK